MRPERKLTEGQICVHIARTNRESKCYDVWSGSLKKFNLSKHRNEHIKISVISNLVIQGLPLFETWVLNNNTCSCVWISNIRLMYFIPRKCTVMCHEWEVNNILSTQTNLLYKCIKTSVKWDIWFWFLLYLKRGKGTKWGNDISVSTPGSLVTGLLLESMFDSLTCLRKLMVGERTASEWRQHQLDAASDAAKAMCSPLTGGHFKVTIQIVLSLKHS